MTAPLAPSAAPPRQVFFERVLLPYRSLPPRGFTMLMLVLELIRADMARRQLFRDGRVPEFLADPTEVQRLQLSALVALRSSDMAEAAKQAAAKPIVGRAAAVIGARPSRFPACRAVPMARRSAQWREWRKRRHPCSRSKNKPTTAFQ